MKMQYKILFLLLLLIGSLASHAHNPKTIKIDHQKYARINDTLYAAIYEVTNADYRAFLNAIHRDSNLSLYHNCLYDSARWVTTFPGAYNDPMRDHYHSHLAFSMYPVVNISWFAAKKYCEWLTEKNSLLHTREKYKFLFKLPSEKEWILIANADPTGFPSGLHDGKDAAGKYQVNIKTMRHDSVTIYDDGGFYTIRVDSYLPNAFGLYNVIGNVSEMTDQKDVEKGGNWWTKIEDCAVDKREDLQTPDPRVGFRVVVIILK